MKELPRSVTYIKSQARKLKRTLNITHVQALELLAKQYGYSNWQHCQRDLIISVGAKIESTLIPFHIGFNDWLKRHKNRNSPLGDLSRAMLRNNSWPNFDTLEEYGQFLPSLRLPYGATVALERAWKRYLLYIKSKNSPRPIKSRIKKKVAPQNEGRKITIVKDAPSVQITERTVEKFKPGDQAWVSWNGRRALPITITEVDNRHYTFIVERPLKKRGNEHYVFHDEVGSTPKLACTNYVTF
ncbi:glyoxalase superfamily protein [Chitinophaga rhizosphaerae]|uniref:glyoxalase superfamily protein n=1 Tax=Chitinophaga rhizosphaerae TaxID=1864947 RepID=UPI000F8044C9|nr:glyoxalase superfamily protein [Chitinophaga rhizosphaerae]